MMMTMRPAAITDIMDENPRIPSVMKVAAVTVEATATSVTARPPKLLPALFSFSARLAIWPHL